VKKAEIEPGELYEVPAPSEYGGKAHQGVKVTVVECGVPRPYSSKLEGVLVRLEEPYLQHMTFEEDIPREVGYEYVVAARHVIARWDDEREERMSDRERRRAEAVEVEGLLLSMGLAREQKERRHSDEEGLPGFRVQGANKHVVVDLPVMLAWLKRIDPVMIAGEAIDLFVENVVNEEPWKGLKDATADECTRWREAAVREIREGVAVSEAELHVDG
jgi:hypothetical protein